MTATGSSDGGSDYGSLKPLETSVAPGIFAHKNSAALTAGIIVADVVGAGILSMAVAVSRLGWLVGGVAIVLMLLMNAHTSILLWKVHAKFPEAQTYRGLAEASLHNASESMRKAASRAVYGMQSLYLFLMLGLYMLTMGKCLGMLFHDVHICLPDWTFLVCLIVFPISVLGRKLGSWSSLIWLNCCTILGTIALPLVYFSMQGLERTRPPGSHFAAVSPKLSVTGAFSGLSTFAFGMTGQFIMVEILAEMRDPREFPKAYGKYSAPFQGAAFLLVGLGGYYYKGDSIRGMINESLPFGTEFRVAAVLLGMHMVVTYVIKGTVLCKDLLEFAHENISKISDREYLWAPVVAVTLALSLLISQMIPFFTDLVDLLGASLTPTCCWIVPIAMYVRTVSWRSISGTERAVLIVEVLFAVALTLIGTTVSVYRIRHHWVIYGGPFSCHCEGMWSTCDCSGGHAGLEECPPPFQL